MARTIEDHAVEGPAGLRAANTPGTCTADDLRERGARLEQRDNFRERIDQDRTPANEIRTIDCSKSGGGDLSSRHCKPPTTLKTAQYFLDRDWKVIASMRSPREDLLPRSERLRVLALDVTDSESIRKAVDAAGPIDALVNNAGIGLLTVFEGRWTCDV
jgi:hypothetical protein